jgi:pimeloyl-ACP methyl ester carboxylesterase
MTSAASADWPVGGCHLKRDRMEKSGAYVKAPWRYEVVEGASHWVPLDTPDELNALLLDWLQVATQLDD